jgi:thiamine pyrophosphokinase
MAETVLVFAGGDPPPPSVLADLPREVYVIAADSGFDHAHRLGIDVDLLVGDLDSISAPGLAAAKEIEQHPTNKDSTDLAIALDAASKLRPSQVVVIGGAGGRIDHFLANAALLASSEYVGLELTWLPGQAVIHVVRQGIDLSGSPGDLVSLLPYHGPALGVTTDGLRWPLRNADLSPGTSRGVSNQMVETRARVSLKEGVLLTVQPVVF